MRHVAVKDNEVATLTATIETNLPQGDLESGVDSLSESQTSVAPSETWLNEDLEKIYALLFRNVGRLTTPEFVVLVPDPIGIAPWSVLLDRGEPCDSCQDTPHEAALRGPARVMPTSNRSQA